jgi:glycosyltransferase involved in cell wall biosynthesis
VVDHGVNRGYGAALRTGFASCTKDWIFYTDGDAQYDVRELARLIEGWEPGIDIINGYKIARSDPFYRVLIGAIYNQMVKWVFGLKLRDIDCDFRLIRRSVFDRVRLHSSSGVICVELIRRFQDSGCIFKEVPVHHFFRAFGRSQFFNFRRLWRTFIELTHLWWEFRRGKSSDTAN